jgi:hypothetical protein
MENCSDGFNVPREHTAKLYIVGKRIMGSIATPVCGVYVSQLIHTPECFLSIFSR